MDDSRLQQALVLPDGRTLGFAEVGDPDGYPLVFLHGTPSSRLDVVGLDEAAARHGWRVLAPDRPGHGRSSPQPGRTVLDWPVDFGWFVDAVVEGPTPVAVLGFSGGAPYALAVALRSERTSVTALVSGWGPPDRPGAYGGMSAGARLLDDSARHVPAVSRTLFGLLGGVVRRRPDLGARILGRPHPIDPAIDPFLEALRQGAAGPTEDLGLIARPFGFELGEVAGPVHLWHGDADADVPPHHADFIARMVPDSTLTIVAGADHRLLYEQTSEILGRLAEVTPGR